jgi:predicted unusual protein kinase regulating ubiquinone biosynthesis (AarF/ABC1/UbiB family)
VPGVTTLARDARAAPAHQHHRRARLARPRTQRWIERNLAPRDMTERWQAQHSRNAEELYAAAIELQGPILKGAQWLGSRPDLLPPQSIEVLARLQDRVPARPTP